MQTTTLQVATASLRDLRKVISLLGGTIADEHSTPGAVGYTTITVTR